MMPFSIGLLISKISKWLLLLVAGVDQNQSFSSVNQICTCMNGSLAVFDNVIVYFPA